MYCNSTEFKFYLNFLKKGKKKLKTKIYIYAFIKRKGPKLLLNI